MPEPKRCQEEPRDLQKIFHVDFKANFNEANSSYEDELRAFFFFTVSDIGSPLPDPHKNAYNPSFCSEERPTQEMSSFLSYGDNLTF